MIYRPSFEDEIPAIAELKLKMFEEVGMSHLLMNNFIEEVISVYRTFYNNGKAQHFVIEDYNKIIACARLLKKTSLIVSTKNENMVLSVMFMLNQSIGNLIYLKNDRSCQAIRPRRNCGEKPKEP